MRDERYFLDGAANTAAPPFNYFFVARPWPAHGWSLRDGRNRQVGTAPTRAGARAGVRALYASAARSFG